MQNIEGSNRAAGENREKRYEIGDKTMTTPMPKTWNKIKAEYAGTKNKALRETIFRIARNGGSVLSLLRTIAFSNPQLDRQRLGEIEAVAQAERNA